VSIRSVLFVVAAASCLAEAIAQDQPRPEFGLREQQPGAGSLVRRQVVGPTVIPLNLSYEQLSPQDRARFNGNYEAVPPGDEPPFPVGGLKVILDPIGKAQAKLSVTGNLFVIAKVDSSGVAHEVTAVGSPSPEMTQFASQVLLLTRFKPARCSGQPCAMEFPLRMQFQVN